MGEKVGYVTEQLMELAGLSVSQSIYNEILTNTDWKNIKKVLTICGPGSKYIYYLTKTIITTILSYILSYY